MKLITERLLTISVFCLVLIGCIIISSNIQVRMESNNKIQETETESTREIFLERFGDIEFEKGTLKDGKKVIEYKGNLKDYTPINGENN